MARWWVDLCKKNCQFFKCKGLNNIGTFIWISIAVMSAFGSLRTATISQAKSLETAHPFPLNSIRLHPLIQMSAPLQMLPWKLPGFQHDFTEFSYSQLDSGSAFNYKCFIRAEHWCLEYGIHVLKSELLRKWVSYCITSFFMSPCHLIRI